MTAPDLYTDDEARTLKPKRKRNYAEWRGQEIDWVYLQKALPLGALVRGIDQSGKRSREANMRRLARGCLPGTPDTYIFWNGITLWLERKIKGGSFGPGQREFCAAVLANKGHWAQVTSTEDVELACLAAGIPLRATLGEIRQRIDEQNERLPAKRKRVARKPVETGDRITVKQAHALGLWK